MFWFDLKRPISVSCASPWFREREKLCLKYLVENKFLPNWVLGGSDAPNSAVSRSFSPGFWLAVNLWIFPHLEGAHPRCRILGRFPTPSSFYPPIHGHIVGGGRKYLTWDISLLCSVFHLPLMKGRRWADPIEREKLLADKGPTTVGCEKSLRNTTICGGVL